MLQRQCNKGPRQNSKVAFATEPRCGVRRTRVITCRFTWTRRNDIKLERPTTGPRPRLELVFWYLTKPDHRHHEAETLLFTIVTRYLAEDISNTSSRTLFAEIIKDSKRSSERAERIAQETKQKKTRMAMKTNQKGR